MRSLTLFASISILLAISESIYDFVFANIAFTIEGTATAVSITFAFGFAAEICVTIIGAGFIDARSKWHLFVYTQILNTVVFAVGMAYFILAEPAIWAVWGFAFLIDAIHQYSRLIVFAMMPFLFAANQLDRAHGVLAISTGLAKALGPTIGAFFAMRIALPFSLSAALAAMLIGILLTLFLRLEEGTGSIVKHNEDRLMRRLLETTLKPLNAARTILADKNWRGFMLAYSTCMLVIVVVPLMWVPLFRGHHDFTDANTGFLFACATLGSVLGGAVMLLGKRLGAASFVTMAVGLFASFVIEANFVVVGVGVFLFHTGATLYFRSMASLIQQNVPREIIGGWYGAIDFISRFVGMAGVLLLGILIDAVDIVPVFTSLIALIAWSYFGTRHIQMRGQTTHKAAS